MHGLRRLREDATRWAALLPMGEGVVLHVSGCAKGCARPQATAATLIATESGYDLVVAGRTSDQASRRGLSSAAIEAFLVDQRAALFEGERPRA